MTKEQLKQKLTDLGGEPVDADTKKTLEEKINALSGEKQESESKSEPVQQMYYSEIPVRKTKKVRDMEKNLQIRVSLYDGTVKQVPEEEYRRKITYK